MIAKIVVRCVYCHLQFVHCKSFVHLTLKFIQIFRNLFRSWLRSKVVAVMFCTSSFVYWELIVCKNLMKPGAGLYFSNMRAHCHVWSMACNWQAQEYHSDLESRIARLEKSTGLGSKPKEVRIYPLSMLGFLYLSVVDIWCYLWSWIREGHQSRQVYKLITMADNGT